MGCVSYIEPGVVRVPGVCAVPRLSSGFVAVAALNAFRATKRSIKQNEVLWRLYSRARARKGALFADRAGSADAGDGAHCQVKKWTPAIHMFRKDSRILLEITAVRVERLQDITEQQAIEEGVHRDVRKWFKSDEGGLAHDSAGNAFADLWCTINGPESWNANPWVWVVEFKQVTP